jgi:hypothetical protein
VILPSHGPMRSHASFMLTSGLRAGLGATLLLTHFPPCFINCSWFVMHNFLFRRRRRRRCRALFFFFCFCFFLLFVVFFFRSTGHSLCIDAERPLCAKSGCRLAALSPLRRLFRFHGGRKKKRKKKRVQFIFTAWHGDLYFLVLSWKKWGCFDVDRHLLGLELFSHFP